MDKLVDKYLAEGSPTNTVVRVLQQVKGVKVKKVDMKRTITFTLSKGIDENDFDNFDKIDTIHEILKKAYPKSITTHDYNKFIVEEL